MVRSSELAALLTVHALEDGDPEVRIHLYGETFPLTSSSDVWLDDEDHDPPILVIDGS